MLVLLVLVVVPLIFAWEGERKAFRLLVFDILQLWLPHGMFFWNPIRPGFYFYFYFYLKNLLPPVLYEIIIT